MHGLKRDKRSIWTKWRNAWRRSTRYWYSKKTNWLRLTDHRLDILFLERKKGNPIQSSIHPSSQTWTRMHSQRRKAHKERKSSSPKFMQKWEKITFRQWRRPLLTHPLNLKSPKIQKKLALHRKKRINSFSNTFKHAQQNVLCLCWKTSRNALMWNVYS